MDKQALDKYIKLFKEFFRYAIVGGIAFLADSGTLFVFKEFILKGGTKPEIFASTAMGFIAGLAVNYILSIIFVFKKSENSSSGKGAKAFIVFTVIGIIGLGLTELGMYAGVYLLKWHYLVTKVITAALVLVWNYCGRKIFVFNK
ncbi:MAG: GtrA family protein [Oscillospiraceae bacterium]|nr:GtrA family protein [Oscillospiraceae bacterium]